MELCESQNKSNRFAHTYTMYGSEFGINIENMNANTIANWTLSPKRFVFIFYFYFYGIVIALIIPLLLLLILLVLLLLLLLLWLINEIINWILDQCDVNLFLSMTKFNYHRSFYRFIFGSNVNSNSCWYDETIIAQFIFMYISWYTYWFRSYGIELKQNSKMLALFFNCKSVAE